MSIQGTAFALAIEASSRLQEEQESPYFVREGVPD
jgi:hypothetical protein